MPIVARPQVADGKLQAKVTSSTQLVSARLHFTTGPHKDNPKRPWVTQELQVEDGMITGAAPPPDATAWYVDVTDERKLLASSEVIAAHEQVTLRLLEIVLEDVQSYPIGTGTISQWNTHNLSVLVLDWMSEHVDIPRLKEQIQSAVPTDREYTGCGSFTTLAASPDLPPVEYPSPISGPAIEAEGIEYGGGALLFLDDTGHITQLEMYAYGDRFSESITTFCPARIRRACGGLTVVHKHIFFSNPRPSTGSPVPEAQTGHSDFAWHGAWKGPTVALLPHWRDRSCFRNEGRRIARQDDLASKPCFCLTYFCLRS